MANEDTLPDKDTVVTALEKHAVTSRERRGSIPHTSVDFVPPFADMGASTPTLAVDSEERYGGQAEIGSGGMGHVYRVRDQNLNRDVAMKVLRKDARSTELVNRFHVEAQIGGQLEHPGLLPVHDLSHDEEGNAFFTMRYVAEHVTLSEIIERLRDGDPQTHHIYTMERRVQLIQAVAHALSYAHQRGVVHRDVKPDNIVVGVKGEVYLVDWGVATLVRSSVATEGVETTVDEEPLADGSLIGTLRYMSPEQLLGDVNVGPRSDVYALCAVAYELFSLHHYLGDNGPNKHMAILEEVLHGKHIDAEVYIDSLNSRVPRQLSRILRWGLQKDRDMAFGNADALNGALQEWVEGRAPVVCPGTFIQRRLTVWGKAIDRRPFAVPAISLVLATGVIACVVFTLVSVFRATT